MKNNEIVLLLRVNSLYGRSVRSASNSIYELSWMLVERKTSRVVDHNHTFIRQEESSMNQALRSANIPIQKFEEESISLAALINELYEKQFMQYPVVTWGDFEMRQLRRECSSLTYPFNVTCINLKTVHSWLNNLEQEAELDDLPWPMGEVQSVSYRLDKDLLKMRQLFLDMFLVRSL